MYTRKIKAESHCNKCGAFFLAQYQLQKPDWAGGASGGTDTAKHLDSAEKARFLQQLKDAKASGREEVVQALLTV